MDYTGIKLSHAVFEHHLLNPLDDTVDTYRSMILFHVKLNDALKQGFPAIELQITCVPGTGGGARITISGNEDKKKSDRIVEFYIRIWEAIVTERSWIVKADGTLLTEEEKQKYVPVSML